MNNKKINTLVIIGNGFDIWQNLNTNYGEFKKYYLEHRKNILKELKIKEIQIKDEYGNTELISDVELIYGNPFDPQKLDDDFWYTFEASLDKIDAYKINLYFGKSKKELKRLKTHTMNAKRILQKAFCDWIQSIEIPSNDNKIRFKSNCYFVNFNYTETLEKRFNIDEDDVYHVHGYAKEPESIIVGHCSHPQSPEEALKQIGGRFRGLYHIEEILFETDKHTEENIIAMSLDFGSSCINAEDIKDIYILGHSFGDIDMEYFRFFKRATGIEQTSVSPEFEEDEEFSEESFIEEIPLRINYVIKRYGGDKSITEPIYPEEEKAILKKCRFEQFINSKIMEEDYFETMKEVFEEEEGIDISDFNIDTFGEKLNVEYNNVLASKRIKPANWHISYYSQDDKKRIQKTMKELGIKNYTLYDSIDKAIENIKI